MYREAKGGALCRGLTVGSHDEQENRDELEVIGLRFGQSWEHFVKHAFLL